MKFLDTIAYKNQSIFNVDSARNILDQIILFKFIQHNEFKKLLEIGYFEGLTFSLLYEASDDSAELTACDITFKYDKLSALLNFKKSVSLKQCSSKDLKLQGFYDFINIDGEHSYQAVKTETELVQNYICNDGVIMIDDFHFPEINKAIDEFIDSSNFIPFLIGPQQMFLSQQPKDVSWLINETKNICCWNEIDWQGHSVQSYNYKNKVFIKKLKDIIKEVNI